MKRRVHYPHVSQLRATPPESRYNLTRDSHQTASSQRSFEREGLQQQNSNRTRLDLETFKMSAKALQGCRKVSARSLQVGWKRIDTANYVSTNNHLNCPQSGKGFESRGLALSVAGLSHIVVFVPALHAPVTRTAHNVLDLPWLL
jgi:hypothetical protein